MSLIQEALRRQEEDSRESTQPASKEVSAPAAPTPPPVPEPPVAPRKTVPGRSDGTAKAPPSMAVADRRGAPRKRFSWPILTLVLVLLVLFSSAGLLMYRVLSGTRRPESGTGPEPTGQEETSPLMAVPDPASGQVSPVPGENGPRDDDEPSQDTQPVEMGVGQGSPQEGTMSDSEPGEGQRPGGTVSGKFDTSGSGVEAPGISDSRTGGSNEGEGDDREAKAGFVDEGTRRPGDDPGPVRPAETRPEHAPRVDSPKSPETPQKGGQGTGTIRPETRDGERRDSGAAADSGAPSVRWPRLRITGVLQSSGRGAVIVNNQVISVGETIMGAKLVEVFRQGAEFLLAGETRRFHVGQGEGGP